MRRRFRFDHEDSEYAAFGEFGPDSSFSVVQLLVGAAREGSSGMKVLVTIEGADSAEQLRKEIEKAFPDLTGFRPF